MAWLCGGRRECVFNFTKFKRECVCGQCGGGRECDLNLTKSKRECVFQGWWACVWVFGGQLLREYSLIFGEAFSEG